MAWERPNIVIIKPKDYAHSEAFREIAETLQGGFGQLGIEATVQDNVFVEGAENIILGWHLLAGAAEGGAALPDGSILYNLEQMDDRNHALRQRLKAFSARYRIWDYSPRNIAILRAHGLTAPVTCVPIGSCASMARIPPAPAQDLDVLFYGSVNDRRLRVLNALKDAGVKVLPVFGVYGRERDALIARAKLVLNLHFYESSIFEMVRVSYLLANRKVVVAECNAGTEGCEGLEEAVKLVPYEGLVDACLELLKDPLRRKAMETLAHDAMASRNQGEILRGPLEQDGCVLPAVSVVVITRNRPGFLARALGSLAGQTFRQFETLVVNDGGEDVLTTVQEARKAGLDLRYFNQALQLGQSAARNVAIRAARGTWIAYLDDDDLYYPDHLETLVATLKTTGAKVAYTDSMRVVEEERGGQWAEVSRELAMSNGFSRELFLQTNLTPINNVMHERVCWDILGPHDETLPVLEDWDYWIRMSRKWDFVHVPKATAEVRWRANGANITFQKSDLFPPCRERIAAKIAAMLEEEARLALPAAASPAEGKEALLFEPDWAETAWVEVVLAFFEAFRPGEPVTLVFLLAPGGDPQAAHDQALERLSDLIRRTGRETFPDLMLVAKPEDWMTFLRGFGTCQWIPAKADPARPMAGPHGERFTQARRRLTQ